MGGGGEVLRARRLVKGQAVKRVPSRVWDVGETVVMRILFALVSMVVS